MRRLLASLLVVLATVHASARRPQSNEPQQTFRAGVDLVRLDVSVLDKDRRPIHGLRAEDFTVLEDGQPQPVIAFASVDIPAPPPVAAEWMRQIGPDVVTNQLDLRRIIVIVMDDGTTASDERAPVAAREVARAVIDRLGPNDLAAVVFTLYGKPQNFTSDRRQLLAAVDSFTPQATGTPGRFTAAANPRGTQPLAGPPLACQMPGGCLNRTLQRVAAALEDTPVGRKTIFLISSGVPYNFTLENLALGTDINDLKQTFRSLQRANANVYPFDPRGLTNEGIVADRIDSLRMFAENTGGRATIATNTPSEQVPQVFLENSSYYLLGIRPAAGRPDSFRRITVKVARPDVEVRARAGYFAPGAVKNVKSTQPQGDLEKAFGAALPSGTLPLDVAVAPFAASDGKNGVVIVTTSVRRPVGGTVTTERLEVRTAAFESAGLKERARQHRSVEITLRPNTAGERRFEIQSRLALRPGRYEIRAAAEAAHTSGGVFTQIEVPDFSKARLSLSGVVLGLTRTGQQDSLADLLPVVPTAARAFPGSGQVAAFVRVYQGGNDGLVPVQMRLRIVDATTRAVVDESMMFEPVRFGTRRSADCSFQLPLSRLADGEYLLTVDARADKNSARREIRFRVRDTAS